MDDLKSLSIADLKATLDYVEKLKRELLDVLKNGEKEDKDIKNLEEYDRLLFLLNIEILKRIEPLKKL